MTIIDVMKITGLGRKTLCWLYTHVFHKDEIHKKGTVRHFTKDNVQYILNHQKGIFDIQNQLVIIPQYNHYYINKYGDIYTYKRNFFELVPKCIIQNYYYVKLYNYKEKKLYSVRLHRLLAQIFIPNPNNLPVVNHKNGNKLDNKLENLEWTTVSENTKYAYNLGLANNAKGFEDSQSIPIRVFWNNGIINEYGSLRLAERITGISMSNFSRWMKNGKSSTKFSIKYVERI